MIAEKAKEGTEISNKITNKAMALNKEALSSTEDTVVIVDMTVEEVRMADENTKAAKALQGLVEKFAI